MTKKILSIINNYPQNDINLPINKPESSDTTTCKTLDVHVDPRSLAAQELFNKYPSGNILLYKVPRAGATTSFCAESLYRNEKFVAIEPTNKIGTITVKEDIKK